MSEQNVTAVYNTVSKEIVMVIVDAQDLTDPAWNPENCIHIPVEPKLYHGQIKSMEELEILLESKSELFKKDRQEKLAQQLEADKVAEEIL